MVTDDGLECFRVKTPSATYDFHKQGAGFASLIDADGNDWIGFHPGGGPRGEYRGIPNMGFKHFGHPGSAVDADIVTQIESRDGDRVVLRSVSADANWAVRWTFHPDRAELAVEKVPDTYWFLHERTPGGSFEKDADYYVRASDEGRRQSASVEFAGEMADPEWIHFGDPGQKRALLLVKHEADCWHDRYFPMDGMTVFGFGRAKSGTDSFLRGPAQVTISLVDTDDHATIAARAAQIVAGN